MANKRGMILVVSLIVAVVIWFAVDGYINYKYGLESTASWLIYTSSFERPIIPYLGGFFSGLIAGHLWWGAGDSKP